MTERNAKFWARLRAFRRNESGQALIEVAISAPLLLLLLLGAAEFARVAYAAIEVSNAASAAALYAASSRGAASSTNTNISAMAVNDAANLVSGTGGAVSVTSITASCSCADTTWTPSSCSDTSTCTSHSTSMVETIKVNTQATYTPLVGPASFTLRGQAVQTVSNQ